MSSIQCAICTDLMTDECVLLHLKCGHVFHQLCVDTWFRTSMTCPECRKRAHRNGATRLFLKFTDDAELAAREKALTDKLSDQEAIVKDMQEKIGSLEANKQQMLAEERECKMELIRLVHVIEGKNTEIENCKQKIRSQHVSMAITISNLTEQLKQAGATIKTMRNENAALSKSNEEIAEKLVDLQCEYSYTCLVANTKLESEKDELSAQLNQYSTVVAGVEKAQQEINLRCESLKKEKEEMANENADLKGQLKNAEGTLNEMLSENMMSRMRNEENELKLLKISREQVPLETIAKTLNDQQCEFKPNIGSPRANSSKRMNEENQQCTYQNAKRQKILDGPAPASG